jgi:hypothetical protein
VEIEEKNLSDYVKVITKRRKKWIY